MAAARHSLLSAIWILGAWLYVRCGVGRARASKAMHFVFVLVFFAIRFGMLFAHDLGNTAPFPTTRDVRTAMAALNIKPVLQRSVCCPKCFAPYALDALPEICPRRETPLSRPCREPLWMTRKTKTGPKRVPRRLYTTQSFVSWLEHFLSRPGIEACMNYSYRRRPRGGVMRDIQDGPAWEFLGDFTFTHGNLVFSYYIDWFNPLTNKIAGKKVSCGAIMLFCLNLPPELRHLPENTFFAGLTPPPFEPNVVTITATQDPIVDQLEELYVGRVIRSYAHPLGLHRRIAVLPFIADLMALQKAGGFANHGHRHFCWYCPLPRKEIERLDIDAWGTRSGFDVRVAAQAWRAATTKTLRKELFDAKGVRWSSLMRLTYRDPVRLTVLGVMHNWLEGVLQHHARRLWGLGVDTLSEDSADLEDADAMTEPPVELNLDMMDVDDTETVDDELSDLLSDSQSHADTPSHARNLRRFATTSSLANLMETSAGEEGDDHGDDDWLMADNEDPDSDSDEEATKPGESCIFTAAQLAFIRACIADVVLPTWMARPPKNLGEKSHGKLKADNWFVLFTVHLLVALVELWGVSSDARQRQLLGNFANLVTCTNIVCSFSVTDAQADEYTTCYVRYRQTLRSLFPGMRSVPNLHYAMHNGPQMKFWGPLMAVSEFAYEQHNGTLQKIKTNGHLRQ
jgi:hypothetical protein